MEQDNNILDFRRFWRATKSLWWVYLLSAVLCVGAAGWFVSRSLAKVPVKGQMLIGEESMVDGGASMLAAGKGAGGLGQMMKTFSIGGFGASAVDNEVLILGSHDVMLRTVKTLELNRSYIGKNADGKKRMLWRDTPVRVEAPKEYFDTLKYNFNLRITLLPGGKADIKATKGLLKRVIAEANDVKLPASFTTPLGTLQILRGETFDSSPYREITVNINGDAPMAINLAKIVDIDVATKLSDVIDLELDYPDADLGKAIIDGVMAEYNAKRLDRVHETAVNSIKYYDERIAETLSQLETAERKVADYKRENSLSGTDAEAKVLTEMGAESKALVVEAQHRINYYENVIKILRSGLNSDNMIPQMASIGDSAIASYNALILERRDLRRSATDENPSLIQLNQKISSMADLIQTNADMMIDRAKSELNMQIGLTGLAVNRLSKYPEMELDYTALFRDKELKNALYLYLVQARENAVLKLYADTDLGFVFQPAFIEKPGLPVKKIAIVLAALVFALIGSTVLSLLLMWRTQRVKAPMDVAFMHIDHRALNYTGTDSEIERMRTMLMADPGQRVIYLCDLQDTRAMYDQMVQSFAATGHPVVELTAESNSALLSPEINSQLTAALASEAYVLVKVPQPTDIFILENAIDRADSALLIVVPDSMRRRRLKEILKGQSAGKIYTIITKV